MMIANSGFIPAALVGVSAGAAYGVAISFAIASIRTLTGAVVAFLLSRSMLRRLIEYKLRDRPRLSDLDKQISNHGRWLVCLLRLSPVMPFAATSYALGLSSIAPIALREYVVGTLASLPSLMAYVLAGALVKTGVATWSGEESLIRLASLTAGRAQAKIRPARQPCISGLGCSRGFPLSAESGHACDAAR
jgi:uncharacterized membrane protein YdjX (TVP38/TMEM64 family)